MCVDLRVFALIKTCLKHQKKNAMHTLSGFCDLEHNDIIVKFHIGSAAHNQILISIVIVAVE